MCESLPSHKEIIGARRALVLGQFLGIGHGHAQAVVQGVKANLSDWNKLCQSLARMSVTAVKNILGPR